MELLLSLLKLAGAVLTTRMSAIHIQTWAPWTSLHKTRANLKPCEKKLELNQAFSWGLEKIWLFNFHIPHLFHFHHGEKVDKRLFCGIITGLTETKKVLEVISWESLTLQDFRLISKARRFRYIWIDFEQTSKLLHACLNWRSKSSDIPSFLSLTNTLVSCEHICLCYLWNWQKYMYI